MADRSILTPWGFSQGITHYTPWLYFASTAGHGGFFVSPSHNRLIPRAARKSNGWYEEDCEWSIPFVALRLQIVADAYPGHTPTDEQFTAAIETLREWYPEHGKALLHETVTPEQSSVLRRRLAEAHAIKIGAWCVRSALQGTSSIYKGIPDKVVGVWLARGHRDGAERKTVLMTHEQYATSRRAWDRTDPLSGGNYFSDEFVAGLENFNDKQ